MQDRVPLYPGRVTLTPVSGQANTYDLVRADQATQQGSPLIKATFLKDATAALFGLGTGAVPDDVLAALGKYKQHWWRRRTPSKTKYVEKQNNVTASDEISSISCLGTTVWVSNTIYFDPTTGGNITLVDPEEVVLDSWDSVSTGVVQVSKITNKAPCYLKSRNTASEKTYYLPDGATTTSWSDGTGTMQVRYQSSYKNVYFGHSTSVPVIAKVVTNKLGNIPAGEWEYLHSSSRSAYPDSGTSGGYEYEYLGIPLDNAVTAPKIATGSYTGTGTYGSSSPNSLTFGFVPKLVFVHKSLDGRLQMCAINGDSECMSGAVGSSQYTVKTAWENKKLSWYSSGDSALRQLNESDEVYNYLAIG